jgi:hypothetical protein
VVHTSTLDVEVLGTKFNVEAYSARKIFETSLMEGKVKVKLPHDDKNSVVLVVDLFQFDGGVGGFFQGAASEEIGGIIIVTQHIPFRFFHYGGKLLQVTNHQQLYASKGFVSVPIPAEYGVDGIQQICPHHTYFINDQQIHASDDVNFFFAEPEMFLFGIERGIGDERCKWQLEKGVDGNASRIDGSYSGGGDYDCAFGRFFLQIV